MFSPLQIAEVAGFFLPRERRRGRKGFSITLPVIHAYGNNLGQAVSTQEKPCIVWTALCQIVQGVADGCCGFTGNIRCQDRTWKYQDQIRQNFSGYKLEERQATPLLTGADLSRGPRRPYSSHYHLSACCVLPQQNHGFIPALHPHNLG